MGGRCLIVANQTLGGEALNRAVKDCIRRDVNVFYVVVPITPVEHETPDWTGGFGESEELSPERARAAMEEDARLHQAEINEARKRGQRRLELMIEKIRSVGGEADGEVGTDDPLAATKVVLEGRWPFDEVIVSTLPSGLSRWLKMDLPNRVARITDVPVTTVQAET